MDFVYTTVVKQEGLMSLRWVFLVLILAYGVNVFAVVENFNKLVKQAVCDQHNLESELQTQLGINNEITPGPISESESAATRGFKVRIVQ